MFAQGGLCYFCSARLSKADASVEHLVPTARAGSNSDDNCVACCKAINSLLGSMSLKEKIKVVLNQKGTFVCPNRQDPIAQSLPTASQVKAQPVVISMTPPPVAKKTSATAPVVKKAISHQVSEETATAVLKTIKNLGPARPRRIKTLMSTMKSFHKIKLSDKQIATLIEQFRKAGKVIVNGVQVSYKL
ncbi:HNH endonuclease [Novilysobacter antarcticus]|uniref:HNH endonuclease n=1 Tax=Novilysobacter antarcticus TaxID=2862543 RepID=UPI003CCDF19B